VFRSAIRFFIHSGRKDEAVFLANARGFADRDPWLMAAALGASEAAGQSPVHYRQAKFMLGDGGHAAKDLSELASALGTLHMADGSHRLARKAFRQSLEAPTENAVAQAEWAHRRDPAIPFDIDNLKVRNAFEAKAVKSQSLGRWDESLKAAQAWMDFEPFNPDPFIHTTCIATIAADHLPEAIEAADRGLTANPQNPSLFNNLARMPVQGMVSA
jgi:tetratricopeptide (TPR) repeat protein